MKRHFLFTQEERIVSIATVFLCAVLSSLSFALQKSTGPNGSNAQAVHDLGYTGQGIAVGLISQDHARYSHEAFAGHAHWYDATDQNNYAPSNHDTSVGGIICSRGGAAYPNDKGVAPDAELYSFKVVRAISSTDPNLIIDSSWIQTALDQAINDQCKVIVTAIQLSTTANGNSIWSLIYDYYAYQHHLIFATAAGNYASRITVFGDTYNSITTGGLIDTELDLYDKVGSGSNPGPTVDGRQKPDITAPSQNQWVPISSSDTAWRNEGTTAGQTSWAVPHTGGVAAILLSYADSTTDEADDGRSEVIKAVIVNSTFPNIIGKAGPPTTGLTWQKDRGYGRLDALLALKTLQSARITPGSATGDPNGWAYDSVASGQLDSYTISGIKNERLVATLTWNRRVVWKDQNNPNNPGYGIIQDGELVPFLANLDLEIYDPNGILISPIASTIDNLEKADLLLSKTGDYEIRVANQPDSESAAYGLAFEILLPLAGDVHVDYVVDTLDVADLASYWLSTNCDNPIEDCYGYNLSPDSSINLSDFAVLAENWLTYDSRYHTSN